MKRLKLVSILVISVILALVVIQNTTPVMGRFLWFTAEVPVIVLLLVTAAGGFILGLLVALRVKSGAGDSR